MKIDGKAIAERLLTNLTEEVTYLTLHSVTPTLAVILVGDDPGSLSFVRQKRLAAEKIGARLLIEHLPESMPRERFASTVAHFNAQGDVHGLIIQRPIPRVLGDVSQILASVAPAKDVDGFIPHSPYPVPVASAVITILTSVHGQLTIQKLTRDPFASWMKKQSLAVVGRGETAGTPIAQVLTGYGFPHTVVHSGTEDAKRILQEASIIVSCVGKPKIITKRDITAGVILISVGLFRDREGKLHGDYEEEDIAGLASFYTPTPGGVGPVNVASLMRNLIASARFSIPQITR